MSRTLTVTVTQEHIDKGKRGQPCYCPIALAMNDAEKGEHRVGVRAAAQLRRWWFPRLWSLPAEAGNFVNKFDSFRPVEPFTFTATKG